MDDITEFELFDPNQVDGVRSAANGAPFLMLKALDDGECSTCHGTGKIKDGNMDCPDCDSAAATKAFLQQYPEPLDDFAIKFVSAADRKKMARSGVAMPNGDFPIPDKGHLSSAFGRLKEYTGDKAKAKAHILRRAKALGVSTNPDDWDASKAVPDGISGPPFNPEGSMGQTREMHPNAGPNHMDTGASGAPGPVSYQGAGGPEANREGYGDLAPDKSVPLDGAEAQTRANARKADVDMTGSKPPNEDEDDDSAEAEAKTQTAGNRRKATGGRTAAETEAEDASKADKKTKTKSVSMANPNLKTGGDADGKPGSDDWENKDAALAEAAHNLLSQATAFVAQFEAREKSEVGKSLSPFRPMPLQSEPDIRRAAELLSGLVDGKRARVTATKELEQMTPDELTKLLDDRDQAARTARKEARKTAAAKEKAKAEKIATKAAQDPEWAQKRQAKKDAKAARKAAQASAPVVDYAGISESLAKTLEPALKAAMKPLEDRVINVENQPARPRPAINGSGVAAGLTAPVVRGQDSQGGAFKALEDAYNAETDPLKKVKLGTELTTARVVAYERNREGGMSKEAAQQAVR